MHEGLRPEHRRRHHFDLRDRVKPGGTMYDYLGRELLSISAEDRQRLPDTLLAHLQGRR